MKLKVGKYHSQWGLGISYTYFNNLYRSIVLDLIFFYIEWVITYSYKPFYFSLNRFIKKYLVNLHNITLVK